MDAEQEFVRPMYLYDTVIHISNLVLYVPYNTPQPFVQPSLYEVSL